MTCGKDHDISSYSSDISPVTDNIPKLPQATFAMIAESELRHFSVQQPWT